MPHAYTVNYLTLKTVPNMTVTRRRIATGIRSAYPGERSAYPAATLGNRC